MRHVNGHVRVCACVQFWLEWGPETVAVLHCNTSVYRTGLFVACFLTYVGKFSTIHEALADFTLKRLVRLVRCLLDLVTSC